MRFVTVAVSIVVVVSILVLPCAVFIGTKESHAHMCFGRVHTRVLKYVTCRSCVLIFARMLGVYVAFNKCDGILEESYRD